jgi:hypothetical protein
MAMTEGLKSAFSGYVQGIMNDPTSAAKLTEKGLATTRRQTELANAQRGYAEAEAKYRVLVAQKRDASDAANKALNDLYDLSSAVADQIVGTLGKDDPLSKEIRNWRDGMVNEAARGRKQAPQA